MCISLTDVLLQEVTSERSDAVIVELGLNAALRVPQSLDVIAHFVLDGQITIEVDQLDEPVTLQRGEYGLLLYGSKHRIAAGHGQAKASDHVIGDWPAGDQPGTLTLGSGRPAARFISAALRLANSPVSVRSQHPLSELVHLKHELRPLFSDAALVTDVNQIRQGCQGPGANAFINTLMNLHLTHAMRCGYQHMMDYLPHLSNAVEVTRSPTIRPVAVAVRLLKMHPERHWTVAELAQEVGQSRSAFAANFCALTGIGPIEYLNKLRMEKAAELLQSRPDLSLCAIARHVGYDNSSSFARAFKARFAVAPKTYLRQDARLDTASAAGTNSLAESEYTTVAKRRGRRSVPMAAPEEMPIAA